MKLDLKQKRKSDLVITPIKAKGSRRSKINAKQKINIVQASFKGINSRANAYNRNKAGIKQYSKDGYAQILSLAAPKEMATPVKGIPPLNFELSLDSPDLKGRYRKRAKFLLPVSMMGKERKADLKHTAVA